MSIILALETSSELASCALLYGDTILRRDAVGVRTHSLSILPMVQSLLAEAGLVLADCDAIAYGSGPGSFTGVRTACGVAQGLAFGAHLPVVPVVTLAAMALACHQQGQIQAPAGHGADILAVLDARMGEVYWAQYHFDGSSATPQVVIGPTLSAPDGVLPQGAVQACGNGLEAYAAAFVNAPFAAGGQPGLMPHAAQVGQLARLAFAAGQVVSAADAQPLYLRNKIAYTSAERLDIKTAQAAAKAATEAAA